MYPCILKFATVYGGCVARAYLLCPRVDRTQAMNIVGDEASGKLLDTAKVCLLPLVEPSRLQAVLKTSVDSLLLDAAKAYFRLAKPYAGGGPPSPLPPFPPFQICSEP